MDVTLLRNECHCYCELANEGSSQAELEEAPSGHFLYLSAAAQCQERDEVEIRSTYLSVVVLERSPIRGASGLIRTAILPSMCR